MNKRSIKKAFERQTPDVLGAVLSECGQTENKDWQIVRQPKKRSPWLAVACAVAVLAVVVSIGTLAWKGAAEKPMTEPSETTAPIEMSQLVTDAYRGTWGDYEHAIPKLNIDSSYAERVNEDIAQSYVLDEDGVLREDSDRSYEYHIEGDVLSLVIYLHENIWVYTLNLSDGSEATREEILSQAGITIQDYLTRATWDLGNTCCSGLPEEDIEAFLAAPGNAPTPVFNALWETLVRSNVDSTQPFLAEDGLCFIGDVYGLEDSRRVIFRYDSPVAEAPYYQTLLKHSSLTEGYVTTVYEGTSAPIGSRVYRQSIPCVLFGSEYAKEVNQEIWELCSAYLEADGKIHSAVNISFEISRFSDMFSLQLLVQENENPIYRAYNFDIDDGSKVEKTDLLKMFSLSQEDFDTSVTRSLGNFSCSFSEEEMSQYVDTVSPDFAKSVSPENVETAQPLVIIDDLYVIGTVYYLGTERMVCFQYDNPAPESPYYEKMMELYQIHLPIAALVVEAYSNSTSYRYEGVDYELTCSIPQLRLQSAYAQEINRELADYYNSAMKNDGTWDGGNVSYEYFVNGDILSLVVYLFNPENSLPFEIGHRNMIYNIRLSDGSKVSTDEILQAAGVTREAFYARAREFLGTYCLQLLPDHVWETLLADPNSDAEGSLKGPFIATVAEKNLEQVIPYLTEDGTLHFAGLVYDPTGGFAIEDAMSSVCENFEVSPYYEKVFKLCKG